MNRRRCIALIPTLAAMLLTGCAAEWGRATAARTNDMADVRTDRMLVWKGYLVVRVADVSESVAKAIELAKQSGGYLESRFDEEEGSTGLRLRVPVAGFAAAVDSLEALGRVQSRQIESEDVTNEYVDVDARLKNKTILRDRLQQLLVKATEVKDILAIETELNRVQGDIDSMQARINILKGQVDLATIRLTLERKPILGPLGYLFKGLFWGIEKLFVIRQ